METISLCGDNCDHSLTFQQFFFLVDIFSVHPIFMVGLLRFGFSYSTICIQQSNSSAETRECAMGIRGASGAVSVSRAGPNIAIRLKIHWRYFHINGILSHDWVLSDTVEINVTGKHFSCISVSLRNRDPLISKFEPRLVIIVLLDFKRIWLI